MRSNLPAKISLTLILPRVVSIVLAYVYPSPISGPSNRVLCSGGFFALDKISGFKREFSLEDTS